MSIHVEEIDFARRDGGHANDLANAREHKQQPNNPPNPENIYQYSRRLT